jgi:hypothetical protein
MNRFISIASAMVITISLAGCTLGPKSYGKVSDLKSAFMGAGGACPDSTVLDTSSISSASPILKGMSGISCTKDIGMFVFPSQKARDYMIDLIDGAATASKTGIHLIIGPNWLIGGTGLDTKKFAPALGGTARY